MWIARNKEGILFGFNIKPIRDNDYEVWKPDPDKLVFREDDYLELMESMDAIMLPIELFQNLKWKDEPVEVELVIKNTSTIS